MKDFFKNVAATIVGLFAFGLIMTILGFICIIGMVASSNSKPALKDNAVMVMKLQGQIEDRTEDNWLGELTGEQFNNIGMNRILSSIRKAKNEDKVKGIYLETGILETDYATLQEMHLPISRRAANGLLHMVMLSHRVDIIWLRLPTRYM